MALFPSCATGGYKTTSSWRHQFLCLEFATLCRKGLALVVQRDNCSRLWFRRVSVMSCLSHPSSMLVACAALQRCRLSAVLLAACQVSLRLALHALRLSNSVDACAVGSGLWQPCFAKCRVPHCRWSVWCPCERSMCRIMPGSLAQQCWWLPSMQRDWMLPWHHRA